jgi:hypothetical protein
MKPETVMWLFPIMFMVHDFEEILLMQPWGRRYTFLLNDRLPPRIRQLANRTLNLSTGGFAFAVMVIFLSLSILTYVCVEFNLYNLWMAAVILYFFHLVIHLGQSLFLKLYVPAVVTSLITGLYSILAVWYGFTHFAVTGPGIGISLLLCLVLIIPVLVGGVIAATRFDRWRTSYGQPQPD